MLLLPLVSFKMMSSALNAALWAIVHSPYTMSLESQRTFALPEFLEMLHVRVSVIAKLKGNLNSE